MKQLWVEEYRPNNFEGFVFKDKDQENLLKQWIKDKYIPHLLFHGGPGCGKSTLAKALANELGIDSADFMEINASQENNVETVREKIDNFCKTLSLSGLKIILLDECLSEDEEIQTPYGSLKLKDLEKGDNIDVLSFNMETEKIENDRASVISDEEKDVYEVELEDGRTIEATLDHPFLVRINNKVKEKKLKDLYEGEEIITVKS